MPPRFTRAGKVVRTVSTRCPARCMPACAGKVVRTVSTRCPARCIPACTGESRAHRVDAVSCSVHPRTRGEHNSSEHPMILLGSPPRVRGVQQLRSNPHRTRSTPALAGNPASASNPSSCSVHPRSVRGIPSSIIVPQSLLEPCTMRSIRRQALTSQSLRGQGVPRHSGPSSSACHPRSRGSSHPNFRNHFPSRAACGRSDDELSHLRAYGCWASRATRTLRHLRRTPHSR